MSATIVPGRNVKPAADRLSQSWPRHDKLEGYQHHPARSVPALKSARWLKRTANADARARVSNDEGRPVLMLTRHRSATAPVQTFHACFALQCSSAKVEQVIHSQSIRHAAVTRTRYMRERLRRRPPHIFVVNSSVRVRHVTGGSGRIRPAAGAAFLLRFQPDTLPRADVAAG